MKKNEIGRRGFLKRTTAAGAILAGTSGLESLSFAQGGSAVARVPMKELGTTGVKIPVLGMGGSQKFDARYDRRLHRAFQIGITYFDSSERYSNGQSHRTLATFFEQVERKNVWITSKVSSETHPARNDAPPEHFKNNVDKVLNELKTDYLDMFFMHGIDDTRFLEPEFIKMSEELKKSKKINFFGFSCHGGNLPALLEKAAQAGGIDAIMFRYSFRTYGDAALNRAIDAAKEAGIGLLAMKTMGAIAEDDERILNFQSQNFTLPQAKLKTIWADDRIDCCVSEMENIQMVQENSAAALSTDPLAMEEFHQLNRLAAQTAGQHCLGCRHLCESKVDRELKIADTLRYLMYHQAYGKHELARECFGRMSPEDRDFEQVDLEAAMAACPQGIRLDQKLAEASRILGEKGPSKV